MQMSRCHSGKDAVLKLLQQVKPLSQPKLMIFLSAVSREISQNLSQTNETVSDKIQFTPRYSLSERLIARRPLVQTDLLGIRANRAPEIIFVWKWQKDQIQNRNFKNMARLVEWNPVSSLPIPLLP